MVIAAVLIMLVIVLGTTLLSENIEESLDTTAEPDVPEVLLPTFSVVIQKPATTTKSTSSPVVTTTASVVTVRPLGKEPLVCIMGEKLTSFHQFPPDEMCDYIFYDSLYKDGSHNLLSNETTYTEGLNIFLNNRRGYRHTTLGIGFAFDPLQAFWNRAISHAGILDTPTQLTRRHTKFAIETLARISRVLDTQRRRGVNVITAIAVPLPEVSWAASFAEDFREYSFTPSLFISFGHYRLGDNMHVMCAIVPQTRHPDDIPRRPMQQLRWLYSNGTVTTGVVSVTLKGRWAHPVSSENVSFYDACVAEAIPFGSYTEIGRTFTYDNERAFAEKLCRVKALGTSVPFGIAVYDVDYDDYYNKCHKLNKQGAHSRLKALRRVVDYFKETAPFDETFCRTFVKG
ncbi:hypothetical protein MTO96_017589 [Rhipicephalus appendiculatus]